MIRISRKSKTKLIISAGLILASLILIFLFSKFSGAFFPGYRKFSVFVLKVVSAITGILPFSLWDIGAVLLAVGVLILLFKRRIADICIILSALVCFAVFGWLLNHYAPPLAESFNLTIEPTSKEELAEATTYYLDKAIEYSSQVNRDDYNFYELAKIAGKSYVGVDGFYNGSKAPVKRFSLIGEFLMHNGIIGMFMPLTAEASVPSSVPKIPLPFSMTHEAAHRLGIASEQEANFAAFLACTSSKDVRLIYSGYYEAFNYCLNSLYKVDADLASNLLYTRSDAALLIQDRREEYEIYKSYERPSEVIADKINDTYLKTFGQESGIMSYGEVTDYLIAYYKSFVK